MCNNYHNHGLVFEIWGLDIFCSSGLNTPTNMIRSIERANLTYRVALFTRQACHSLKFKQSGLLEEYSYWDNRCAKYL